MKILKPKLLIYKDETTFLDVSSYLRNVNIQNGDVSNFLDQGIDNSQQKLTFTLNNSNEKNFNPLVFYGAYSYAKALLKGNGTNNITYPFDNILSNTIGCITYGENRTVSYDNYTLATFTNFDLQNIENYDLENGSLNIEIITYDGSISHDGNQFIFDKVIDTNEWIEVTFAYYDTTKLNDINVLNNQLSALAQVNAYVEYYQQYGDLELYREEITYTGATEYTLANELIKGSATPYYSTNTNVSNQVLYNTTFKTGSSENKVVIINQDLQIGDIIGIQYSYINGTTQLKFNGKMGNQITSERAGLTCVVEAQDKPLRVFYTLEDQIREYSSAVTLEILIKQIMEDTALTLLSTDTISGKTVYTFTKNVKLVIEDVPLFNVLPQKENLSGNSAWDIIQDYMAQSTYWLGVEYSPDINDIALVLRFPPRSTTETPVLTCTSSDIIKSVPITISDKNMRDKIVVKYIDGNKKVQTVTKENSNSTLETTQIGIIELSKTSAIDTQEEAENLAQTVLDDLSTVTGQVTLTLNYTHTRIRLFDTIQFYDRLISDQPLLLFVESINESVDFNGKNLTITISGSTIIPRTHYRRWLKTINSNNKFENNVKSTYHKSDGITIGVGATSNGGNGINITASKDTTEDTLIQVDTGTGDLTLQNEDGNINLLTGDTYIKMNQPDGVKIKAKNFLVDSETAEIKNSKNRFYFEPTGNNSQVLIDVDYTNTTLYPTGVTAEWQVGDTDRYYFKYENGEIETNLKKLSVEGENVVRTADVSEITGIDDELDYLTKILKVGVNEFCFADSFGSTTFIFLEIKKINKFGELLGTSEINPFSDINDENYCLTTFVLGSWIYFVTRHLDSSANTVYDRLYKIPSNFLGLVTATFVETLQTYSATNVNYEYENFSYVDNSVSTAVFSYKSNVTSDEYFLYKFDETNNSTLIKNANLGNEYKFLCGLQNNEVYYLKIDGLYYINISSLTETQVISLTTSFKFMLNNFSNKIYFYRPDTNQILSGDKNGFNVIVSNIEISTIQSVLYSTSTSNKEIIFNFGRIFFLRSLDGETFETVYMRDKNVRNVQSFDESAFTSVSETPINQKLYLITSLSLSTSYF